MLLSDKGITDVLSGMTDIKKVAIEGRNAAQLALSKAERDLELFNKTISAIELCTSLLREEQRKREDDNSV